MGMCCEREWQWILTTTTVLLGDSITQLTCWRPLVWDQIVSAGLAGDVDLVGSMNDLNYQCSRPNGFDPDHEGHSGWQAYDIARNNIAGWVQNTKPDVVQFMLGTNDVNIGKRDVQSVLDSYTIMLDAMREANPNVRVIVSPRLFLSAFLPSVANENLKIDKLIPTSWSDATIEGINSAIPDWAAAQSTTESPVEVADCSRAAGFTNNMLQGDGVHPNSQGDQFIAEQVGPKLVQFISDALADQL